MKKYLGVLFCVALFSCSVTGQNPMGEGMQNQNNGLSAVQPKVYLGPTTNTGLFYVSDRASHQITVFDGTANAVEALLTVTNVSSLAFAPDGRRLYVSTFPSPDILIIDTVPSSPSFLQKIGSIKINTVINSVLVTNAHSLFADPTGNFLYFNNGTEVGAIDLRPCSEYAILPVSGISVNPIAQAAFTPDGKELWWPADGGFGFPSLIYAINTDPDSPGFNTSTVIPLESGINPQGISISPDGSYAYISMWGGNRIRVMLVAAKTALTDIFGGAGFAPRGNAITPDGSRLYAVTDGLMVLRAYDAGFNTFLGDLTYDFTSDGVHFVQISLDGTRAYIVGSNIGDVKVADISVNPPTPVASLPIGLPYTSIYVVVQPWTINNSPPAVDPISNISVPAGGLVQFTVSASDPDGDVLSYSVSNLPAGAAINSASGLFTWLPDISQLGTNKLMILVNDGISSVCSSVTIVVNPVGIPLEQQLVEDLIDYLQSLGLHHGIENSLLSKLNSAAQSISNGQYATAVNQLGAFINAVQAQSGKKIPVVAANELIARANSIISLLQ